MLVTESVQDLPMPVGELWAVLARLDGVSEWNPIIGLKGRSELNAEIRIMFKELAATWPNASGPARIILFDPPKAIGWRIRIPWLLEVEETVTLLKSGTGTLVTRRIVATGLVAKIARSWLSRQLQAYIEGGNQGLKSIVLRLPNPKSVGFARAQKRTR